MNDGIRTAIWISASFLTAFAVAAVVIAVVGAGEDGTIEALRVTARVSFLLFWPAYAGGLFRHLRGSFLRALARQRREFGLGFAAAHLVHVALILWLFHVATRSPVPLTTIVFDGIGIGWVYILAALSFNFLRRKFATWAWRVLFNFGLEYIALIFLSDFLVQPLRHGQALSVSYLPFTFLLLIAALSRWAQACSRLYVQFVAN